VAGEKIRIAKNIVSIIITLWCITVTIFHIPNYLGIYMTVPQGLAIGLILVLLLYFLTPRKGSHGILRWYDLLPLIVALPALVVTGFYYQQIEFYESQAALDGKGVFLAMSLAGALLFAAWRAASAVFSLLLITMMFFVRFQAYLPGLLRGRGYELERLGYAFYVGSEGIYGTPFNIALTILIMFIIFGELFLQIGGGEWFFSLASRLMGRTRGLMAKVAVVSSFFFGMISGSPASNVATTGSFTIPLMKKTGYSPELAGAVEATASTGGQIMPPVMGSIAFIMAEWLSIPYYKVCLAAAIPATLYFALVFAGVSFEALKNRRQPLSPDELDMKTSLTKVLIEGWFYLIPIGVLVYLLLIARIDPARAGFFTIVATIFTSFFNKDKSKWLYPRRIVRAIVDALDRWLTVAIITSTVGIMIGSLALSGLGVKFSSFILDITGGQLLLILLAVAAGCFLLGFGLDSIPMYIMMTILTAPALVKIGISEVAAHLFVIYWGMTSFITPPVCIALYVACGISGGNLWRTGYHAVRLGVGYFVVPFAFVLSPALLMQGSVPEVAWATFTALIGGVSLAAGLWGFFLTDLNGILRVVHMVGGILLILRDWRTELAGAILIATSIVFQLMVIRERVSKLEPTLGDTKPS
jgi:TRAP transporter 4TM/12TM fusion protein